MLALATADVALTFRLVVIDLPTVLQLEASPNDISPHIRQKNSLFVTDKQVPFEFYYLMA